MTARIKERRRRKRVAASLPIEIKYNKNKLSCQSKNISVLGTYIETNREIPTGLNLNIAVEIPATEKSKKHKLNCQAVAFRSQQVSLEEKFGTAIFFRSFVKNGEKRLSKYIDYILRQEKKRGEIFMRRKKQRVSKAERRKS